MSETTGLVAALAKVQGHLPSIKKDAKGNYGKYVTLDAIHEAVLPLLSANELAWVTMPTYDDNGEPILEYKLMHSGGEKLEGKMRMYVSQPNSQQQGSAITYAKRYAICAVVGVTADDDDDGEAAKTAPAAPYVKKPAQAAATPQAAPVQPTAVKPRLSAEQIKEVGDLADKKGHKTKAEKAEFLSGVAIPFFAENNFMEVEQADYEQFKKAVISAGWSKPKEDVPVPEVAE